MQISLKPMDDSCYNVPHKSALAMLETSESVARINQRLRRIDPDVPDNNTPYREIPLTQGKVALVDDEDYERVSQFKWCARISHGNWYAHRGQTVSFKCQKEVKLHRFILDAPPGVQVDHKNGNGLDCRRGNLRLATHAQNMHNRGIQKNNSSGFKGVRARHGRYYTQIRVDGKPISGPRSYATPEEAARVYDSLALKYFGEFAWLNFPTEERAND